MLVRPGDPTTRFALFVRKTTSSVFAPIPPPKVDHVLANCEVVGVALPRAMRTCAGDDELIGVIVYVTLALVTLSDSAFQLEVVPDVMVAVEALPKLKRTLAPAVEPAAHPVDAPVPLLV